MTIQLELLFFTSGIIFLMSAVVGKKNSGRDGAPAALRPPFVLFGALVGLHELLEASALSFRAPVLAALPQYIVPLVLLVVLGEYLWRFFRLRAALPPTASCVFGVWLFLAVVVWLTMLPPLGALITSVTEMPVVFFRLLGGMGMCLDLSRHVLLAVVRKGTQQLLESEQRFRNLFEHSPDPHLLFLDQRIIDCNAAAMAMLKGSREEILGRTILDFSPPLQLDGQSSRDKADAVRQHALMNTTERIEWIGKKLDGTLFWAEASRTILMIDKQVMSFLSFRDISDRKKFEDELERSNEELTKAMIRANELALRAEAATVAKNHFLSNMSHELRTPMNGVLGMAALLLETKLDEEQRSFAELIRTSGESLLTLIENVLDVSTIETGALTLVDEPFELSRVLHDVVSTHAVRAHEKHLRLVQTIEPDVPLRVRGDAGRLRQVLTNLVDNAIKFTREGEVAITLSTVERNCREVVVRFAVCDTGIGIAEEKRELLFEKFSQVDTSTTRAQGGSGLGLALARYLTGLMGGEIGMTSRSCCGSEFWFTARLRVPPDEGDAAASGASSSAGREAQPCADEMPIFDPSELLARARGDEAEAHRSAREYVMNIPHWITSLENALEAGNTPGAASAARVIRVGSVNVGARRLADLAIEIELASKTEDTAAACGRLTQLKAEFAALTRVVEEMITLAG